MPASDRDRQPNRALIAVFLAVITVAVLAPPLITGRW